MRHDGAGGGLGGGTVPADLTPTSVVMQPNRTIEVDAVMTDPLVNDSGSAGVGHTVTAQVNGAALADDSTPLVAGNVVLLFGPDSGSTAQRKRRGPYLVVDAGRDDVMPGDGAPFVFTRLTTWDQSSETTGVTYFSVGGGSSFYFFEGGPIGATFGSTRFQIYQVNHQSFDPNSNVLGTVINAARIKVPGDINAGDDLTVDGDLVLAAQGTCGLAGATTFVSTNLVGALTGAVGPKVIIQRTSQGSAPGHLSAENFVAGSGFDIISSSGTDDGAVAWWLVVRG